MAYTTWSDAPGANNVPPGEYNLIEQLKDQWGALVGFNGALEPSDAQLLAMANANVVDITSFAQYMHNNAGAAGNAVLVTMPWAALGLQKDEYESAANTYATEYKKVTGQDISADALAQAFKNPRDPFGDILSGTEYAQQLMNDAAIQKQFGWVKYGMDFTAWTQQKLQLRTAFGRDINDAEAATLLQYNKAAAGSNLSAVARGSGQQQQQPSSGTGVSGSFAR